MELKGNIKDYTLNRFIEEVGVSKTSMVRYLKNININKFSYFKNVPILFPYRRVSRIFSGQRKICYAMQYIQ